MLVRLLGTLLSPPGERGALSILIFHRVLARPDPIFPDEPDVQRFDALLSWIGGAFNVMPLDLAVAALAEGRLPARAAAILQEREARGPFSSVEELSRVPGLGPAAIARLRDRVAVR